MSKRTPQPDGVARPQAPYSPVVVDGDLVYTAGQVAFDEQGELVPGGIEEQARRALESLTACLRAGGAELADVLKVNTYLAEGAAAVKLFPASLADPGYLGALRPLLPGLRL